MATETDTIEMDTLRAYVMADRGVSPDGLPYWTVKRRGTGGGRVWSGRDTREGVRQRMIAALGEGTDRAPAPAAPGAFSVRALLDDWIAHREREAGGLGATVSGETVGRNRREVGYLVAALGDVEIERMDSERLAAYKRDRLAAVAPLTVRNEIGAFMQAWTWGATAKKYSGRRFPMIRKPQIRLVNKLEKYTPPDEHVFAVIDWLGGPDAPGGSGWQRIAVMMQATLGNRQCGYARCLVRDVDFDREEITLREKKVKGNPTGIRVVPLPEALAPILRDWIAARGLGPEDHLLGVTESTASKHVGTAIKMACLARGFRTFTTHAVRRAVVDRYIAANVHTKTAASILGHSEAVMLRLYAQTKREAMREAMATVATLPVPTAGGDVLPLRRRKGH